MLRKQDAAQHLLQAALHLGHQVWISESRAIWKRNNKNYYSSLSLIFPTFYFGVATLNTVGRPEKPQLDSPAVMITTAQKRPISASERLNWLSLWASSKTESMRNFALPVGILLMDSRRMMSPFKQIKPCCRRKKTWLLARYIYNYY